jgi:hypothetical protein
VQWSGIGRTEWWRRQSGETRLQSQFPCKQGIYQGISEKSATLGAHARKKPLRQRAFFEISLSKLTGKNFLRAAIFMTANRENGAGADLGMADVRESRSARSRASGCSKWPIS